MQNPETQPKRIGAELEERTLRFTVEVVAFVGLLSRTEPAAVIGRQMLRAAASIGANYREANRAESRADFVHKTALSQKEASETVYWIEVCRRAEFGPAARTAQLADEANQLLAIFTTINRKAKGH
ncbi:MAG TPA: four helix bundle protein [Opitutaceae bacterium]|nr:four helix bundle protein [Opitutaceae bacterium]HND60516.1 four helix bundle protein [Opitutaceae bacterium]